MDFEKDYLDEKESLDVEEEFEKPELTKGAARDTDPQYFTNIDGIYAKDATGRAAVEELEYLMNGNNYSRTEQKIGKWIDGEDLYQKTFEVTTLANDNQWHTDALGTSGIDIVDFGGYIEFNSSGSFADRQPLNMWISSTNCVNMDSIKSDLEYRINRPDVTIEKAVITIKYTKPSVQTLNANLIPSDNPFNVSVMESSETPTSNEEPTDEMR